MPTNLNTFGRTLSGGGPLGTEGEPTGTETDALPGLTDADIGALTNLTDDQIAAAHAQLSAELGLGEAGVALDQQQTTFDRDRALREAKRQTVEGLDAAANNAYQRGIFRSGIRIGDQQEIVKLGAEAEGDIQRGSSIAFQRLALRVQELRSAFATQFANMTTGFLDQTGQFIMSQPAGVGGYSSVSTSGVAGSNRNAANIAAAQAGQGIYGQRAKTASFYKSDWSSRYSAISTIGDWRSGPANTSAGQSQNSDHYTGGALDLMLNPSSPEAIAQGQQIIGELQAMKDAGIVRYWLWEPNNPSNAHYDHIHVSFQLGASPGSPSSSAGNTTIAHPGTGGVQEK